MALTYGFYNAKLVNGEYDRTYDAEDFGRLFEGLITDGVFPTYGDKFKVTKESDLKVKINTGKAWLNGTWNILDKPMTISVSAAAPLTAIVLQINKKSRHNNIVAIAAGNKITLTNDDGLGLFQYCLAYVKVTNGSIASIESHVGNGSENVTPLATSLFGGGNQGSTSGSVSAAAYATDIQFTKNGFDLTFKDEKGLTYVNNYLTTLNKDGSIAVITNKSAGRSITISYG